MIVRAVFSVVVTLGLLVGALVWHAPGPGAKPAPSAASPVDEAPLVESAVRAAAEVAAQLEGAARDAAPVAREAVSAARQLAAGARVASDAAAGLFPAAPGPDPELAVADAADPAPVDATSSPGSAAAARDAEPRVEETALGGGAPLFREGAADADAVAFVGPSEVVAAHAPMRRDPEAWAALVWRMLDIYERVGSD